MQLSLFIDIQQLEVSIDDAATKVGVSSATIRNWIKTGYLEQTTKGCVSALSLQSFIEQVAGSEKLNNRANKLKKDFHNHDALSKKILQLLNNTSSAGDIAEQYERSLSESYRNREGVYYTPQSVVEDLFEAPSIDVSLKSFCDPCCGSGNFIMRALDVGFKLDNIYGYDIDPVAVAITRKRIFERTGVFPKHIVQADFLSINGNICTYDYIYTNPPWGKKLPKNTRIHLSKLFDSGSSLDTSALFFFACVRALSESGKLGFLLPEAFFNIATFENARRTALEQTIERMIDYGKPFKGLVTKAHGIVLNKHQTQDEPHLVTCELEKSTHTRSFSSFTDNPKYILNFQRTQQESEIIEHIYSVKHITLKDRARWGLGIVTGNNKKFCKKRSQAGYMPVYKGCDITNTGLKEASCFIPKELDLYQQVAPVELYESPSKLIYRFISTELRFIHDTEQRYILNSANLLVPSCDFPILGSQLCSLLNSKLMNWLFRSIFNTHKVLRGDLEVLPIHADYYASNPEFDEHSYLSFLNLEYQDDGTYRIKR